MMHPDEALVLDRPKAPQAAPEQPRPAEAPERALQPYTAFEQRPAKAHRAGEYLVFFHLKTGPFFSTRYHFIRRVFYYSPELAHVMCTDGLIQITGQNLTGGMMQLDEGRIYRLHEFNPLAHAIPAPGQPLIQGITTSSIEGEHSPGLIPSFSNGLN